MGDEYDLNDPIIVYMNSLKTQLNINTKQQKSQINSNPHNSDDSESNSQEYESSNQSYDIIDSDFEEVGNDSSQTSITINNSLENLLPNKKIKVNQTVDKSKFFSKKFKN